MYKQRLCKQVMKNNDADNTNYNNNNDGEHYFGTPPTK